MPCGAPAPISAALSNYFRIGRPSTQNIIFRFPERRLRTTANTCPKCRACQRLTALRPRCSIDFAKKIIMAMISQEDRPELRGEAFRI